jgi:hypothetical protein
MSRTSFWTCQAAKTTLDRLTRQTPGPRKTRPSTIGNHRWALIPFGLEQIQRHARLANTRRSLRSDCGNRQREGIGLRVPVCERVAPHPRETSTSTRLRAVVNREDAMLRRQYSGARRPIMTSSWMRTRAPVSTHSRIRTRVATSPLRPTKAALVFAPARVRRVQSESGRLGMSGG